ncbi:MAG: hypothetical protein Q9221_005097 [Calogaya cf. arnoldii]
MIRATPAIRPLPDDVAAQIKSSTTISSLEHVIIELFKNSLDAWSNKIEIDVDFVRGACTVEDNGLGIKPAEFLDDGGLGKAYHTSKFEHTANLHGSEGTFLASLAAVSILTITSHHHAHLSSATLIYHHTRPAARLVPAPSRYQLANREHGTKVEVHDLFGNMPVRVKQRGMTSSYENGHQRQWETIRKSIVGTVLAWHSPVTVVVRGPGGDRKMILRNKTVESVQDREDHRASRPLNLAYSCSILSQAGYIDPDVKETWIKTSARTPFMAIRGAFSLRPVPSKRTQFLSLGIRYLSPDTGASILYNEINRIFALSSFGISDNPSDDEIATEKKSKDRRYKQDGPTNKQLRGTGKGVDRWPMFVIRIEMGEDVPAKGLGGRDILERESTLASIVKVLEAMTTGFLTDHHFRPRTRQKRRRPGSSQSTHSVLKNAQGGEKASATPSSSSVSTPMSRPGSSRRTDGKTRTTTFGDDTLSCGIQLPKVHIDRCHYAETFSGWSRIKSGTTRGIGDGCLDAKTNVYEHSAMQHDTPSVQSPQEALQGGPSELVSEDTFTWIDPVTKVPCLLNSRTGQSVPHVSERTSASKISGTCEDGVLQSAKRITNRLPRYASTSVAPKADSWVGCFLKSWNNPVFSPATEQAIPQVSFEGPRLDTPNALHARHRGCLHRDIEKAFTDASTTLPSAKLSKTGLLNAKIISQVDKKFILVLTDHVPHDGNVTSKALVEYQTLALIDQHAADERIRIEALLAELCIPPLPETLGLNPSLGITTTLLPKPIAFQIKTQEHRLFDAHAHHFARWGILYDLTKPPQATCSTLNTTTSIRVKYLPPVIAERCRLEPKLLIDLLRREVWTREEEGRKTQPSKATPTAVDTNESNRPSATWLTQLTTCPQGIIDMLNSRACRSAIMFNDELTPTECKTLVARLAHCKFPFQCAHGRPSMVPLVAVCQDGGGGGIGGFEEEKGGGFADAWKSWKVRGDDSDFV